MREVSQQVGFQFGIAERQMGVVRNEIGQPEAAVNTLCAVRGLSAGITAYRRLKACLSGRELPLRTGNA
ncbi:hypothetical protein OKW42_004786 [Paraburkholderia sp. WC7.3d]